MDAGTAGAIAGSVVGLMGGVVGTWFGVANTSRPRERGVAIRLAALTWAWLAVVVAWMLLAPRPWNQAAQLMTLPALLAIPRMNRRLARARFEDQAGS
ncbi:hypothetical protein [Paludisphaera mucosa]|uniref:Uncharacterized protein n=1 Tax=Paludisphaera mucosa TaxID=3030827 RepID=A0ABT6FA97_9BACT|nr:hypothetical protein [Paludisphaera mucosa]MDG3004491.1 hypothetical protein [Paludisphaera mucosa]